MSDVVELTSRLAAVADTSAGQGTQAAMHARLPESAYRAMQSPPLSRLLSNGAEHVHVRTVAILGYN